MIEFYDLRIWQEAKKVFKTTYIVTRHPCLDNDRYVCSSVEQRTLWD